MPSPKEIAQDFAAVIGFAAALIISACLVVGHSPLKVLGLSLAMGG